MPDGKQDEVKDANVSRYEVKDELDANVSRDEMKDDLDANVSRDGVEDELELHPPLLCFIVSLNKIHQNPLRQGCATPTTTPSRSGYPPPGAGMV